MIVLFVVTDQVRTRVFNMIAEYRRILKNPTPERKKKCIFFDALQKIYQAKDANGVRQALNNYEEDFNNDPMEFSAQYGDYAMDVNGDGDENSGTDNDDKEVFSYSMSPSHALNPTAMLYTNGHDSGHGRFIKHHLLFIYSNLLYFTEDSQDGEDEGMLQHNNGPAPKRIRLAAQNGSVSGRAAGRPSTNTNDFENGDSNPFAAFASTAANPYGAFGSLDPTSSALLIDRMFAHLSKETDVMREWVSLERERLDREAVRRREETERDERREKAFLQTLMQMQEQMLQFLTKQQITTSASSATPISPSASASNITESLHKTPVKE